jgi:hypothetical protein
LYNEELHKLYNSLNTIRVIKLRKMRFAGLVAHIGGMRNQYSIFVEKPEEKKVLGRPRHILEDKNKMDLREIGWEGVDWMHLAKDREQWCALVNTVMNLQGP